jgi:CRP-like cAMP-binding protein
MIRIQIHNLLDNCQNCQFRSVTNAGIHTCPSCPIGQQLQKLSRKLCGNKVIVRRAWTKEEDAYIWNNQHLPRKELAERLGRTRDAVIKRLFELRKRGGVTNAS